MSDQPRQPGSASKQSAELYLEDLFELIKSPTNRTL
jgi:hypothetical protein